MTDYEKVLRQEHQGDIERLSLLKKLCAEHDITLQEYLLNEVHTELEKLRILKEESGE